MHSASVVVALSGVLLLATPLVANGTELQSKIAGGEYVDITDYPYMVAVQSGVRGQFCGASIISKWFVLSAARCYNNYQASHIELKVGNSLYFFGVEHNVEKIVYHPKYERYGSSDYDICVIKVKKPFELNEKVAIIPLAPANTTIDNGTNVVISGWGGRKEHSHQKSYLLEAARIPYLDHETCKQKVKNLFGDSDPVTDRMICTLDPNGAKGFCNGDYGGPLVATVNGKRVQIGIASHGGCDNKEYPGVYTSVPKFHSWIIDTIAKM